MHASLTGRGTVALEESEEGPDKFCREERREKEVEDEVLADVGVERKRREIGELGGEGREGEGREIGGWEQEENEQKERADAIGTRQGERGKGRARICDGVKPKSG